MRAVRLAGLAKSPGSASRAGAGPSRWMVLGACTAAAASGGCVTMVLESSNPETGICMYRSLIAGGLVGQPCPPTPTSLVGGSGSSSQSGGSGGSGGGGYTPPI